MPRDGENQGCSCRPHVQGEVDGAERHQSPGQFSSFLKTGCFRASDCYYDIGGN